MARPSAARHRRHRPARLGIGSLYYAWKFSGPVSAQEEIPPGEAQLTQAIIEDAVRIVEQHRDNTRVLRDAHAKAHGCVKAEVTVASDIAPGLRQGVFAEPGHKWEAMVRFSNGNATRSSTAPATPAAWPSNCSTSPAPS